MTRVVLATRNRHKVAEMRRILEGTPIELVSGLDLDLPEVDETGDTFTDNAMLKADACLATTGLPAIADDSGLVVDALGGAPGVRSARYAGEDADDAKNLQLLIERMDGERLRTARFVCVVVLALPGGDHVIEKGVMEGVLADAPRGDGGFGYDPLFIADGEERTNGELAPDEKDAISHRGAAFRALRPHLVALNGR